MTGMEAWSLISPLIAAHMTDYRKDKRTLDALDEAYVLTFGALRKLDKKEKDDD